MFLGLFFVAGILTMLQPTESVASPKDDFWSDDLLKLADSEVGKFSRDQLETLIEYIAACDALVESKDREFTCKRSVTKLDVKVRSASALQRLVYAIGFVDIMIAGYQASGQGRERMEKEIYREVAIHRSLRDAASLRYSQLEEPMKRQ